MSTGRNEPCPCGSGRKYKRCCLAAEEAAAPQAPESTRIRERLFEELWQFGQRQLGDDTLQQAAEAFGLGDEETTEIEMAQLFAPWVCFHWVPEFERAADAPEGWESDCTLAENYLIQHEQRLAENERRYIEAAVPEALSAWQVSSIDGDVLKLRDVLLDRRAEVQQPEAAAVLEPGELLLAAVVEHEGRQDFCGLGTSPLPFGSLARFEEFGQGLRAAAGGELGDDLLGAHSAELLALYRDVVGGDGETPELVHLRFEVESADTAYRALRQLMPDATDADLLESAEFGEDENLTRVEFDWTEESGEGSALTVARFLLRGPQLDVVCDDRESADRVRTEIARRLEAREFDVQVLDSAEDLE
jgi:hypothetical protein